MAHGNDQQVVVFEKDNSGEWESLESTASDVPRARIGFECRQTVGADADADGWRMRLPAGNPSRVQHTFDRTRRPIQRLPHGFQAGRRPSLRSACTTFREGPLHLRNCSLGIDGWAFPTLVSVDPAVDFAVQATADSGATDSEVRLPSSNSARKILSSGGRARACRAISSRFDMQHSFRSIVNLFAHT